MVGPALRRLISGAPESQPAVSSCGEAPVQVHAQPRRQAITGSMAGARGSTPRRARDSDQPRADDGLKGVREYPGCLVAGALLAAAEFDVSAELKTARHTRECAHVHHGRTQLCELAFWRVGAHGTRCQSPRARAQNRQGTPGARWWEPRRPRTRTTGGSAPGRAVWDQAGRQGRSAVDGVRIGGSIVAW